MNAIVGRLEPGEDLRLGLEAAAKEVGAPTVVLIGIGSLAIARMRPAFFKDVPDDLLLEGPLELTSTQGTITAAGETHLHVTVADEQGVVHGGHLRIGTIVDTTAEYVLGHGPGIGFTRARDPLTGYDELRVLE